MYIRCPIAEFDDPRNFIVGRIIQVDDFTENVTVAFLDPFGFRNYYENIPEKAELPYDYVKRCTLHRESYVIEEIDIRYCQHLRRMNGITITSKKNLQIKL